jgi:Cu/Ag efflux pump CusA
VSSTVLTLVVIPAIYVLWKGWELKNSNSEKETKEV